jgi:hypothetical protein
MSSNEIIVRPYTDRDYMFVKGMYIQNGRFDQETDSWDRLKDKIERDPESIQVASYPHSRPEGSVSIIEDGRVAFLFRLVSLKGSEELVIPKLLDRSKEILLNRGYRDAHIFVEELNTNRQQLYIDNGFSLGGRYRWMYTSLTKV